MDAFSDLIIIIFFRPERVFLWTLEAKDSVHVFLE